MEAMLPTTMTNMPRLLADQIVRLEKYITSDLWCAQEKADGHHIVIVVGDDEFLGGPSNTGVVGSVGVKVLNRQGQPRQHPVPEYMRRTFGVLPFNAIFDGEIMEGGSVELFDLPHVSHFGYNPDTKQGGEVVVDIGHDYEFRQSVLAQVVSTWDPTPMLRVMPLACSTDEKRALLQYVTDEAREGLVFKKLTGIYKPGRRSLDCLKFKFRDDADVIVRDVMIDGKSNLDLGAWDGSNIVPIGHCTALSGDGPEIIAEFKRRKAAGETDPLVIVVNYVHLSKGNRLVQPTEPRFRPTGDPKAAYECTLDTFRRAFNK